MTRINLLPWREIRRRERDRQLLSMSIAAWVLAAVVVVYAYLHVIGLIDHQNSRNNYLENEIATLEEQLKEIDTIKARKAALLARMEVIQQLQHDRTQIVHVFDDLVRKLPEGIYLTSLSKKGKRVTLQGMAQSNGRISAFMRNLDASNWFSNPDLNVITVTPQDGIRISKFTLAVDERAQQPTEAVEESVEGPGAAGGAG